MKDQLSIKVSIAGRVYPLTIEHSEEENIRKAVKTINDKISDFEKNYNIKDKQDLLAMSSLQFASQALEIQNYSNKNEKFLFEKLEKLDKLVSSELSKD